MVKKPHPQVDDITFLTSGKLPNKLIDDDILPMRLDILISR